MPGKCNTSDNELLYWNSRLNIAGEDYIQIYIWIYIFLYNRNDAQEYFHNESRYPISFEETLYKR